MFQDEFIKDLHLILFVSRFRIIGPLSSKFASLKIDDFHETKQISTDFDSVVVLVHTGIGFVMARNRIQSLLKTRV